MEPEEPLGHAGRAGELDRLVRIPERLFAQPDRPALARRLVKRPGARPRPKTPPIAARAASRGRGPAAAVSSRAPGRSRTPLRDGRGPLGEVPRRDRADDRRELVAVPRRLPAQHAERREQQQAERAEPPAVGQLGGRPAAVRVASFAPFAASPLRGRARRSCPPAVDDPAGAASARPTSSARGSSAAEEHREQVQPHRQARRARRLR